MYFELCHEGADPQMKKLLLNIFTYYDGFIMKIIRTDRSDKLLKISRPLLASFLLFNSISDVLAEESPSIAGVEQKEAKTKAKKICCKTQTPQPSPPITLETLEVKGKVANKLAVTTQEVTQSPGGVSLININDLHERNVSSVADFFRYAPGIYATSQSGNDEVFISSRGSNLDANNYAGSGVKLLQDGLPVTAADGNNHNRMIDPLASSFATVARGGNAFKYGASTLGGAIDFTSPTAHDSPEMRLALNGGSFGQFLGRGTVSKVFNDSFDGLLTVEGKEWDGYRAHNKQDRLGV